MPLLILPGVTFIVVFVLAKRVRTNNIADALGIASMCATVALAVAWFLLI